MDVCVCHYYELTSGKKPVESFISALSSRGKDKFTYIKRLLEENGNALRQPYSKYLGHSIFELRFEGLEGSVRVLYFFLRHDKVVFTNGFIKKTNKIPKKELDLSIRRRIECLKSKLEGENT